MNGATADNRNGRPKSRQSTRPRALADIQFNTILGLDGGTSSEDESRDAQGIPVDEVPHVLGVSIGQEQTRLSSPRTPAVEKAAAIELAGGFFGGDAAHDEGVIFEEPEDEEVESGGRQASTSSSLRDTRLPAEQLPRPTQPQSPPRIVHLPGQWSTAGVGTWQRSARSSADEGKAFGRRRASSGPDTRFGAWHKALLSSLPSLPKNLSFTTPFSTANDASRGREDVTLQRPKRSSFHWSGSSGARRSSSRLGKPRSASNDTRNELTPTASNFESEESQSVVGDLDQPQLKPLHSRRSQLRRSASDTSLVAHRTLSEVSSLGDDTRFHDVREQVNSRVMAIRNSWQDSNIRLPGLPSMPNFSVASLKPDFLRDRAGSVGKGNSADMSMAHPVDPLTRQPYTSAKAAISEYASQKPSPHPIFDAAVDQLEGDVVVLGGYRGSILRSAEPPHRQVWVPVKVGLNLRKVDLEVGIKQGDDERATDKIIPDGMLSHIGPVDISRRLFKRLRACENARSQRLRVHDYGYDWRLDPNFLSDRLIQFMETLPCNQPDVLPDERGATVIAHSLGGLITRHAVNRRPELFRGVLYAGVPHTCVNILGPLRNGDDVLLSSRVLTAQVNFTIRTSFALLPLNGRCFFDINTKEEYVVDFFDPKTWIDYRLSPCVARPLPPLAAPPKPTTITGSMASVLSNLPIPGRKSSINRKKSTAVIDASQDASASGVGAPSSMNANVKEGEHTMVSGNVDRSGPDRKSSVDTPSVGTTVTLPREEAIEYLTRMLASVKKFKQELAFRPEHGASNSYPPLAVIYGKSTPTVFGARVDGREGIKHADAYDALAFASGDGVVLARAAMVPIGYTTAKGGIASSERGHVSLLGDLEAVGKCLNAIIRARRDGVGSGE